MYKLLFERNQDLAIEEIREIPDMPITVQRLGNKSAKDVGVRTWDFPSGSVWSYDMSTSKHLHRYPKRGLAWESKNPASDLLPFISNHVLSWAYNWSPEPGVLAEPSWDFVPMQWNHVDIEHLPDKLSHSKSLAVLGFNEPDHLEQSNMDPQFAALLWKKHFHPLRKLGVRIGSPAVTSSEAGRAWLRRFLAACDGCEIDFLSVHWYGESIGHFYDYIWSMNGEFGLPLWITEYASTSSDIGHVSHFMKETIKYLDSLSFVERYCWFGGIRDDGVHKYALLDSSGNLNALGRIYLDL